MTFQFPEQLVFEGRKFEIYTQPLRPYLEHASFDGRLLKVSSACWRGYVGKWEIREGHLYLVGITGLIERQGQREQLCLQHLFKNEATPILASWFSGTLRVLLEQSGQGSDEWWNDSSPNFSPRRELLITVGSGRVTELELLADGVPQVPPVLNEQDRGVSHGPMACSIFISVL